MSGKNKILIKSNSNFEDEIAQTIFAYAAGCTFVQEDSTILSFSLRRSFSLVRTHCASPCERYNADLYLSWMLSVECANTDETKLV